MVKERKRLWRPRYQAASNKYQLLNGGYSAIGRRKISVENNEKPSYNASNSLHISVAITKDGLCSSTPAWHACLSAAAGRRRKLGEKASKRLASEEGTMKSAYQISCAWRILGGFSHDYNVPRSTQVRPFASLACSAIIAMQALLWYGVISRDGLWKNAWR